VPLNPYRWRRAVLLTAGPVVYWGLPLVPLWVKFRTIPGGYEARRWFKLAVILSGAYGLMRKRSPDLELLSAVKCRTTQDGSAPLT